MVLMKSISVGIVAFILTLLISLSGCCNAGVGNQMPDNESSVPERLRVIVELALPQPSDGASLPDPASIAEARAKVEAAIRPLLDERSQSSIRAFRILPILSLEADGRTLVELLKHPEVASIYLDQEAELFVPPQLPTE